ncbi:Eco57I restriction-modification methylase domain-containing protein [Lacisediminihabitans changchengi]|uniref:site-specific DNA-methyltransferase (adenine-specific) n=1 Tax=Lacisediminihabitans changchengi TaxID=2787634 RepID=A0A934SVU6_9MICO|nr:Eco57I restriction-modification methylase domain-containing protein [Lacisediminihabitans changchengi]MBK4348959.1 Eco57I restriction-modification methylase domain-containing protein [Lacisediminihabitans changchengi]
MNQATVTLRSRNPDVLTCIANLSNDEVFTPPEFANQMLDMLEIAWAESHDGASIWADPTLTFLDPFTKSGVFLREITSRLADGLATTIPDLQERVDHILTKQVFGIGITQLTSMLARRSLYCSKRANGQHSIAKSFTSEDGNVWFARTEHTWSGRKRERQVDPTKGGEIIVEIVGTGRCKFCGANEAEYSRGDELESHAYAFIHTTDIKARIAQLFGADMHFDVIIGNPPYQLDDGGHNNSATPIYQFFVENAIALDPKYLVMVTPSRWFSGGRGLDKFRERMLTSHQLKCLVDFPKLYDGFPGVKIRGGISYFLWERDYDGPCTIQTMWDGKPLGAATARRLDTYDVLVRRNEAVSILDKVTAKQESTLDQRVSPGKPFGLRTFFHGKSSPAGIKDAVQLYGSQKISYVDRSEIPQNPEWVDEWKVLMTAVQGTSAAVETKFLSKPIIAGPGTASTETYLVAGRFKSEDEATRYSKYIRTRFLRFLVSLRKSTQHANRDVYSFVPDLPLTEDWTDAKLYMRYGLTADEIAFIESQVAAHDDSGVNEALDE